MIGRVFWVMAVLFWLSAFPALAAENSAIPCAMLAKTDFTGIKDAPTAIVKAEVVGDYCAVTGYVQPQVQFEVRLPTAAWNGRYFQTGCGSFCGIVPIKACDDAIGKGFAVAADNMGHIGDFFKDPVWGGDPALRLDYAGRSTHVVAIAAKAILQRYYGKPQAFSYFRGCSTGGREGLAEAQRHPEDFDGIIAGDPAFAARLADLSGNWDSRQQFYPDGKPVFSPAKLALLHQAVLARCDGLDGVKDGIIADPRACDFKPTSIACPGGNDSDNCLTPDQVAAAEKLYGGPRNSHGELLYPGRVPFGSELSWGAVEGMTLVDGFLRYLAFPENPPASYRFRDFDFDKDIPKIEPMARIYDPDAPREAPDLAAFHRRGGRLIMYHGWADPGVYPEGTLDYYAQVAAHEGAKDIESWFRLFMVPGMGHCRGGGVPDNFDMLGPMMEWVEHGQPPERIVARQIENGNVVRSRPLFPYPTTAKYSGSGDVNDEKNWMPEAPKTHRDDRIKWIWAPAS
jgi:feruloyl esterase